METSHVRSHVMCIRKHNITPSLVSMPASEAAREAVDASFSGLFLCELNIFDVGTGFAATVVVWMIVRNTTGVNTMMMRVVTVICGMTVTLTADTL